MAKILITAKYKGVEYTKSMRGWVDMLGVSRTNFGKLYWEKKDAGATDQECIDWILSDRPRKRKVHEYNKNRNDFKLETSRIKAEERDSQINKRHWKTLLFGGGLTRGII